MDLPHGLDDRDGERKALERLSQIGDPLERIGRLQWYRFSPFLAKAFEGGQRPAGAAAYSDLMLLKILILQRIYEMSDEGIAGEVRDRLSFMRFLHLSVHDEKPSGAVIRQFREALEGAHVLEDVYRLFHEQLREEGLAICKTRREAAFLSPKA